MSTAAEAAVDALKGQHPENNTSSSRCDNQVPDDASRSIEQASKAKPAGISDETISRDSSNAVIDLEKAAVAETQTAKALEVHSIPKNNLKWVFPGTLLGSKRN